jgi:hypothetical protein
MILTVDLVYYKIIKYLVPLELNRELNILLRNSVYDAINSSVYGSVRISVQNAVRDRDSVHEAIIQKLNDYNFSENLD